jgi:TctA family transporter
MSGILDHLAIGFGVAFSLTNLLVAMIGSFIGTMVGVLPGLGPVNGVAMLIPIAFAMNLPPETALILLAAVYVGAEYGGRITAILLNVPGEASAIMTTLDGYPLARQGMASVALSLSAWSAFFGAIVSVVGIILLAPLLAKWALAFGPAEYFVLMIFAFCCLTSLLGKQPVKGVLAAMIGLSISVVGVDANSGVYRYTFESVHLADGIEFVVVVIALFAVSEMLEMLEKVVAGHSVEVKPSGRKLFNLKEMALTWWSVVRSSLVGFGVGVLPGAGSRRHGVGHRLVRAHADAGRARFGYHCRDDGRADALQHHTGSGAIRLQARTGVGLDRLTVRGQHSAVRHERAAGALLRQGAVGAGMADGAGHPVHQLHRRLRHQRGHFRSAAGGGHRRAGLLPAQVRRADGAAGAGRGVGQHDGAEPAPRVVDH